jgi:hypothetical protein
MKEREMKTATKKWVVRNAGSVPVGVRDTESAALSLCVVLESEYDDEYTANLEDIDMSDSEYSCLYIAE